MRTGLTGCSGAKDDMRRLLSITGAAMVVALCLAQALFAQAQSTAADPWYSRSPRPKDFEAPKVALGKFTIELPKDWQLVPGYGGVIFTASEKRNNPSPAAIVLERMELGGAVEAKDVTATFANAELSAMRERQPGGQNFEQQVKEADGRRYIFIQYSKPGWTGPDRVVQYSVPAGAVMYRLICIAPVSQLPKYQPLFAHVAASFKAS
jgi:hypothetical protein